MLHVTIIARNTSFLVIPRTSVLTGILETMINKTTTYKMEFNPRSKKYYRVLDKKYFTILGKGKSYIFSIGMLRDFILLLKINGFTKDNIELKYDKEYQHKPLNLKRNPTLKERDYQFKYIDEVTKENAQNILLIDLDTGYGKGTISIISMIKLNMMVGILVLPKYIKKWVLELKKLTNITNKDIFIVQGSDSLKEVMTTKDKYKVIIFSMRTMYNYITQYEEEDNFDYPVEPLDLAQHLGIGMLLNDETHQEFHALFKFSLYFNAKRLLGLSATLLTNRNDLDNMYKILFPNNKRINNLVEYKKFINIFAVEYDLQSLRGIRFKTAQGYNHNLFEQSILKNNVLLKSYYDMVLHYVELDYIARRKKGEKLLIFAASVRFCTIVSNWLSRRFPNLEVNRYVEDDPYENVINSDITVSTVLSAGTAFDIPGLITVIHTVSMTSPQANIQAAGRLREIKGSDTNFIYLYTRKIPNQYKMHHDRKKWVSFKAKTWTDLKYNKVVKVI